MRAYCLLLLLMFSSTHLFAADDWVTDEVLKTLSEIRENLVSLQSDVNDLRREIAQSCGDEREERHSKTGSLPSELSLGDLPRMGSEQAGLIIVEFSDFECPFCKRHHLQVFPSIKKHYIDTGKAQYVMRDFPLGFHRQAEQAAAIARCAARQTQAGYWQIHHVLFSAAEIEKEHVLGKASKFGLDEEKLGDCAADSDVAAAVSQDRTYGKSIGVSGTPVFFIGRLQNGKLVDPVKISGAQDYAVFSRSLESLLKKASNNS